MPINLVVNGSELTNFTMASVTLSLDTLANDFAFQAVQPAGEQVPLETGDECSVLVDGELVLTGFIENITGHYTASQLTISVTGRDRTADLIDSSINVIDDIRSPISLKSIIERVVQNIGSPLRVIDDVNPDEFNKAEDIAAPQPGDNAFTFVEQYAQKRQVLLTSNAEGDIVIARSEFTPSGAVLQNIIGSLTNNILTASWSNTTANLFNKYVQKGQLDPVALGFGAAKSANGLVSQEGSATDSDVRGGRQMVSVANKSFSQEQLQLRAEWSKKIRRVRSSAYSCHVQGFKNSAGQRWDINTLITVVDTFAEVDRSLLLNSIQFIYDDKGSVSILHFVEPDAYTLAGEGEIFSRLLSFL